jgi:hypothetical protein
MMHLSDIPAAMVSLRLAKPLWAALGALAQDNRRTLTAELTLALERHLTENGRWPPPEPPKKK